jgi:hypothetical protein
MPVRLSVRRQAATGHITIRWQDVQVRAGCRCHHRRAGDRVLVHGAFIIYFDILRVTGATNVMLVTLLVTVNAIFLGALILGEALAPRHFAGLALIACGLMPIDGRLLHYARRKLGGDEPSDASGLKPSRMLNDAQNL